MKEYEVMIVKTHWVTVQAETEDEAFELAEDKIPTFSSAFEECEMEIQSCEEIEE